MDRALSLLIFLSLIEVHLPYHQFTGLADCQRPRLPDRTIAPLMVHSNAPLSLVKDSGGTDLGFA